MDPCSCPNSYGSVSLSQNPLVQPVVTPRFKPSCSEKLLEELGKLAKEMGDVHIQSHIAENPIEDQAEPRPSAIFDLYGLLTDKVCAIFGPFHNV